MRPQHPKFRRLPTFSWAGDGEKILDLSNTSVDLPGLFQAVLAVLQEHRLELNQADSLNQNHGDHMLAVFQAAVQAAREKQGAGLDESMDYAAGLLRQLPQNGSAQVYARGLGALAGQFRQRGLGLDELVPYARHALRSQAAGTSSEGAPAQEDGSPRGGEILKALASALSAWERLEADPAGPPGDLDMGALLGMGMAYLQAKQMGGSRLETLAEAMVLASPLGRLPHRAQSGRLVFQTLLREMARDW